MEKMHDRIPMKPTPNQSSTDSGAKGEDSKAKPRCSSPLPVDRNMGSSGEKKEY